MDKVSMELLASILVKTPEELNDMEVGFLNARASYLTSEQLVKYESVLKKNNSIETDANVKPEDELTKPEEVAKPQEVVTEPVVAPVENVGTETAPEPVVAANMVNDVVPPPVAVVPEPEQPITFDSFENAGLDPDKA